MYAHANVCKCKCMHMQISANAMNIHMQKYAHCDAQSLANEFGYALLHCTGASCTGETSQGKIRKSG